MQRTTLVLLSGLLVLAGCDDSIPPPEPTPAPTPKKPMLSSDIELQSLEKRLLQQIEKNRTRRCERPLLRGEPSPGTATLDITAIVEGSSDTLPCFARLAKWDEDLRSSQYHAEGYRPADFPPRHDFSVSPDSATSENVRMVDRACAPVVARISRAASHEDACSPYLVGLRGQPGYVTVIRAARIASITARRLLAEGKSKQGLELLLDTLRFCQDYARGATVLETMIGVAASTSPTGVLELALNQKNPLGPELLTQVEQELGALIASQPHPSSFLENEIDSMMLYSVLPGAKPADWLPPGGWGMGADPPPPADFALGTDDVHPIDAVSLSWIAMIELNQEVLAGCKQGELPVRCYEHMETVGKRYPKEQSDLQTALGMIKATLEGRARQKIRRQVIKGIKSAGPPEFRKYVARQGQLSFRMAALRLFAAYRKLSEKTNSCPGIEAFDNPPLLDLRIDPYSGKPMRVEAIKHGRYAIWPGIDLKSQAESEHETAVFVECGEQH